MSFPAYYIVHDQFKLNGVHFSKEELCAIAEGYLNQEVEYLKDAGHFILQWFDENDFVNVQTSGTTGTPKLIAIKKQAMVYSALATGEFFKLAPGDKALCCLPVKYIAGKMMLVRAFILGLAIDLVAPQSNPLEGNSTIYDFVAMVPLQVEKSMQQLHQIKKIIIGGAKVNAELAAQLQSTMTAVYETYSMTETVTHIAAKRVGEKTFKLLPNVTISTDARNCLVISAPRLNPELIVTNDVVTLLSDTEFIWEGRIDNVINSGGIKLFPEQIEEQLSGKLSGRFFVGAIADPILGEKLVLVIEGAPYELDSTVFDSLSKYEKPKAIYFIPSFLETETGKIKRKEILKTLN